MVFLVAVQYVKDGRYQERIESDFLFIIEVILDNVGDTLVFF